VLTFSSHFVFFSLRI